MIKRYFLLHILLFDLSLFLTIYTKNWWLIPLIFFYFFWILYQYKIKAFILMVIIFSLVFMFNFKWNKPKIIESKVHTATITKIYKSSIVVEEKGDKYYLMGIKDNFIVGDTISFSSKYEENNEISGFNVFYRSTKSIGMGYGNNITVIKHQENFRNNIYDSLLKDNSYYSNFTLAMLYKTKTVNNEELFTKINKLGISHLFIVSGFHISLFYFFIEKIGGKLTKNKNILGVVSFGIILFFLYIIYFPPTGIRALLTIMVINFNHFSKIDSLSFVGIYMFIINPYMMLTNSMILSFTITAMIYELSLKKEKGIKGFSNVLIISISAFFLSLPTILTWNKNVNLFSPLLSIILTPIISFSYIICIMVLPFHNLWIVFSVYFMLLNIVLTFLTIIYLPLNIGIITYSMQIYLTIITFIYIKTCKDNKIILFNSFLLLSLLFIII